MKFTEFKLERYFAQYEFNCKHLLCCSDIETLNIEELASLCDDSERIKRNLMNISLGYTEACGDPQLRKIISQVHYSKCDADQILVHAGAQEAIYNFVHAYLEPGDNIVVTYPGYQSLYSVAEDIGVNVRYWKVKDTNNGWKLNLSELDQIVNQGFNGNIQALILNFPHNPSGYLPSRDEFQEIINRCNTQYQNLKKNIHHSNDNNSSQEIDHPKITNHNQLDEKPVIFCDEVYRGTEEDPHKQQLPPVCDIYENGISLGVMSKSYGLAGLRVGWIATRNSQIYNTMFKYKDFTSICCSAPSEYLATIALEVQDRILDRNRSILNQNRKLLKDFVAQNSDFITTHIPLAGTTCLIQIQESSLPSHLLKSCDDMCQFLIDQHSLLLLPGSLFNSEFSTYCRLGFGREDFQECLDLLQEVFNNWRKIKN
eukprot:gb/GECH01002834.1/.p1 GENE.gb/GECH01002834.1/~~gb/GECH01002834.1/.p1  ORF type:complete len:427 (+),score=98.27 gb/GECH01002834.1/:1-1281(+)